MMFEKRNLREPTNKGTVRIALSILKQLGYNMGLCQHLATDPENGIVGDEIDILRRQAIFGKHKVAMPKVEGFIKLTAR